MYKYSEAAPGGLAPPPSPPYGALLPPPPPPPKTVSLNYNNAKRLQHQHMAVIVSVI